MPDLKLVRLLDRLGSRAWTAEVSTYVSGWIARADPSKSRRVNSVSPARAIRADRLSSRLGEVRAFYSVCGRPARFYISPACRPANLDEELAARGWEKEAETAVQTAPVVELLSSIAPGSEAQVELLRPPTRDWFRTYAVAEGFSRGELAAREGIIGRNSAPSAAALAWVDGKPAGVGLGVLFDDWLGVFCVATAHSFRRKGLACSVMRALVEWGAGWGAERVFLQIMLDNHPGLALYKRLGFTTVYHYHYRTCTELPEDDPRTRQDTPPND